MPATDVRAQSFPGSIDSGRVKPVEPDAVPEFPSLEKLVPTVDSTNLAPRGAKNIKFVLQHVEIKGIKTYPQDQFSDMIAPFVGEEITLDKIWEFADNIRNFYHAAGYTLSQATVPAQKIKKDGVARIIVIEGYVGELLIEGLPKPPRIIQNMIDYIEAQRPLKSYQMESFVKRLNAFPGQQYQMVLDGSMDEEGAMRIILKSLEEKPLRSVLIDNTGSRYTGPYQVTLDYSDSLWSLQQTSLTFITNFERDETKYGSMRHEVQFLPQWSLYASGSQSITKPGSTLIQNQLKSESISFNVGLNWKPIVQRGYDLSLKFELSGKNTNGDILGDTILTRDRIRVARATIKGNLTDKIGGYNNLTLGVYRGLDIWGASEKNDLNLSRDEATPHFMVAVVDYLRQQRLPKSFLAVTQLSGQFTSDPLFSSEEFGYGGDRFGRAYDGSDINGDRGLAWSFELRYQGLPRWKQIAVTPYAYYDVAKVWDLDTGGIDETAASAGGGVRVDSKEKGLSSDFGIAWPLTREIDTPIYGNGKHPRLRFKISYSF